MSASCQSIDSMFELRPIRACAELKSVKELEAEMPSVELIAKLVEVELREICFYVVICIEDAPLGVADGNVHPRQDFPDTLFIVRNNGVVGGCRSVPFKRSITAEPVRGVHGNDATPPRRKPHQDIDGKNQADSYLIYFIAYTSCLKHKVFQDKTFEHLGGLNFANLGTCGHSLYIICNNTQKH